MKHLKLFKSFGINEANGGGIPPLNIEFGSTFKSGQYKPDQNAVKSKIEGELKPWIKNAKSKNAKMSGIKIVISAGESQVTNPEGFEEKGSLASARQKQLYSTLNNIKKNDPYLKEVEFVFKKGKVDIGETKYTKGVDDPRDKKYEEEQYVNVVVDAIADIVEQACKLIIPKKQYSQGEESNNWIVPEFNKKKFNIPGKGKFNLFVDAFAVPDRVVIEYNDKTYDSGYFSRLFKSGKTHDWKANGKKMSEEDFNTELSKVLGEEIKIQDRKFEVNFEKVDGVDDIYITVYAPLDKTILSMKGGCK